MSGDWKTLKINVWEPEGYLALLRSKLVSSQTWEIGIFFLFIAGGGDINIPH
jgi:hypothetical protein